MSSMTMNMYVPRIWGYDLSSAEAGVARNAGWSRADLIWEHLMEGANRAWANGDTPRATRQLRRAVWVGRIFFAKDDLRRATAQINQAIMDRSAGQGRRAEARLDRAAALWDAEAARAVEAMQIAPRARSSLFHLRMEALHRDTYHGNMRVRFTRFAEEAFETICALRGEQAPGHRHFSRWRGEKPSVYDDTRKVLSACLLIFDA